MSQFEKVHLDADVKIIEEVHAIRHDPHLSDSKVRQQVNAMLTKTTVFERLRILLLIAERQKDLQPELVYMQRLHYDQLQTFIQQAPWTTEQKATMLTFMASYLDRVLVNHREICVQHLKTLLLPNQPLDDDVAIVKKMRMYCQEQPSLLQTLDFPLTCRQIMLSDEELTHGDVLSIKSHIQKQVRQTVKSAGNGVGYFRKWLGRYNADIKQQLGLVEPWTDNQAKKSELLSNAAIDKGLDEYNQAMKAILDDPPESDRQPLVFAKMRLDFLRLSQQLQFVSDVKARADLISKFDDIDVRIDQAFPLSQEVFSAQLSMMAQNFANCSGATPQGQRLLLEQFCVVLEDQSESAPVLFKQTGQMGQSYEEMAHLRLQYADLVEKIGGLSVDDKFKVNALDRLEKTINQMAPMHQEVYDWQIAILMQEIVKIDDKLCQVINNHELDHQITSQLGQLYQKLDFLLNDKAKNYPSIDDRDVLFEAEGKRLKMFDQTLTGNHGKIGGIKRIMGVANSPAYVQARAGIDRCIGSAVAGTITAHIENQMPQTTKQHNSIKDHLGPARSGLKRS